MLVAAVMVDFSNASLIFIQNISETLRVIRVRADEGHPLRQGLGFRPGQFVSLGVWRPKETVGSAAQESQLIKRAYSLASAPGDCELEFYIARVGHGQLTPHLWSCDVGTRLFLSPTASGDLTLEQIPRGRHCVMLATGTGIAPFVSMLRHFQMHPKFPSQAPTESRGPWQSVTLLHGVRRFAELGYHQELTARMAPGFTYLPVLSQEVHDSGARGHVQNVLMNDYAALTGRVMSPADHHILLCGNPAMIGDALTLLKAQGFTRHKRTQPGNLHFEKYW